jgi:hypothetical protein
VLPLLIAKTASFVGLDPKALISVTTAAAASASAFLALTVTTISES